MLFLLDLHPIICYNHSSDINDTRGDIVNDRRLITYSEKGGDDYTNIPWGIERFDLTFKEFTLYFLLIQNINQTNMAEISFNEIASRLQITRRTAIRAMASLEKNRLVRKVHNTDEKGSRLSNAYEVYRPYPYELEE